MPHLALPPGLSGRIGLFDRSDRVRVEVAGPDRGKFLHNLTTNEVKRLPVGRGCEAFVTSPQGKTIGHVGIHAADDRILVRADPGGMVLAMPHFQKYGIFDDVAIEDRSEATFEIHLAGSGVDDLVRKAGGEVPEEREASHVRATIAGRSVVVVRESPTGVPGLTLIGERGDREAVVGALKASAPEGGLAELGASVLEALRIEAGTPVYGKDVTEKNLPQEFARDDRAISFVKGCYLGQETVARLDAMGHVNQVLKGLSFPAGVACSALGSTLEVDGKKVGVVTSAVDSPWRGHAVGLGMIRVAQAVAGTNLQVAGSDGVAAVATVVDLPFRSAE